MAIDNLLPTGFGDDYNLQSPVRWRPRIQSGHFYSEDRLLYLYGQKHTTTLRNLTVKEYVLPATPELDSLTVFIDGVQTTDFWTEGNRLFIHQLAPSDHHRFWSGLGDEQNNYGFFLTDDAWEPGIKIEYRGNFIVYDEVPPTIGTNYQPTLVPVTGFFSVPEDVEDEFYKFPEAFPLQTGAPVVITDDTITKKDHRDYRVEFIADANKQRLYTNTPRNLILNPIFERNHADPREPDHWTSSNPEGATAQLHTPTMGAYAGTHTVKLEDYSATVDPTGGIYQIVEYDKKNLVTISARVSRDPSVDSSVTSVAKLDLVFVDHSGAALDTEGTVIGSPLDPTVSTWNSKLTLVNAGWEDLSVRIGTGSDLDPTGIDIPTNTQKVHVRLNGNAVLYDAVQFSEGTGVQFAYIDPSGTVEYETSPDGLFVPNPYNQYTEPFPDLTNLELNGVLSEAVNGFITLREFSDQSDDDLDSGGFVPTSLAEPTTPRGIKPPGAIQAEGSDVGYVRFGRMHLPYAQVNGYNKQVQSGALHSENFSFVPRIVAAHRPPKEPATFSVDGYSGSAYRLATSGADTALVIKTDGTGELYAQFLDVDGNPVVGEEVRASAVQGTLDSTGVYTGPAGRAYFIYTAPGDSFSEDTITFTHVDSGLSEDILIDLS